MKTLTVREAQGQLAGLIAEAHQGAIIVLTDGEKQVWLDTHQPLDLGTDTRNSRRNCSSPLTGRLPPIPRKKCATLGKALSIPGRPTDAQGQKPAPPPAGTAGRPVRGLLL